jgi:hypothetical protein
VGKALTYNALEGMCSYGFTREDLLNSLEINMFETAEVKKEKGLYINLFYDLGFCANWKDVNGCKMLSAPEEILMHYLEMVKELPIYRIQINDDHTVETTCYEMLDAFDPELKKYYETLDDLPKWVQDKLAVLMLLDHTKVNEEVKGVGRRINQNVYWVFNGEISGANP